jgi:phospholipid transport system transporter-binding protein
MFRPTQALTVNNAASMLEAGLRAIASGQTEIDFSDVTVIDSSAVAVVLAWQRAANVQQAMLRLISVPANLQSLATLYGVAELLPLGMANSSSAELHHH